MRRRFQLPLQTADLIAGFMVWVILSSLLPYIKQDVYIPPDQIALVTAIPVVLGSVLRVPFGYCANLFGARAVFLASFIVLVVPVWFLSEATTYQGLLIGGTFLGIAGAVFSVGVTVAAEVLPEGAPRLRERGIRLRQYGNGADHLVGARGRGCLGWRYGRASCTSVLLAAFIVLNFVLGDRDEPRVKTPVMEQLRAVWSDARLWFLSLFYFVTFGAFVALTVYLPNFLTSHYGMDGVSAGVATSVFIVAAAAIRVLGGWLGDRFDCYRLLALVFAGLAAGAAVLATAPGLPVYLAGIYLVSIACGIGNGVVFKLVPAYFTKQAGIANGIVAMMGGLGGFFPPLVLSASTLLFSTSVPGFAAFGAFALACLAISLVMRRKTRSS